jgi:hypothetical protein
MNTASACPTRKSGGIRPKGHPSIAAPGASYAFDFIPVAPKTRNLPLPRQTALRSRTLIKKAKLGNSAHHAGTRTLA